MLYVCVRARDCPPRVDVDLIKSTVRFLLTKPVRVKSTPSIQEIFKEKATERSGGGITGEGIGHTNTLAKTVNVRRTDMSMRDGRPRDQFFVLKCTYSSFDTLIEER